MHIAHISSRRRSKCVFFALVNVSGHHYVHLTTRPSDMQQRDTLHTTITAFNMKCTALHANAHYYTTCAGSCTLHTTHCTVTAACTERIYTKCTGKSQIAACEEDFSLCLIDLRRLWLLNAIGKWGCSSLHCTTDCNRVLLRTTTVNVHAQKTVMSVQLLYEALADKFYLCFKQTAFSKSIYSPNCQIFRLQQQNISASFSKNSA